jgi:hypothetical protein
MGKEVSHKHHKETHKAEHHEKEESRFSLFRHRIADMFREAVEPPSETVVEEKEAVEEVRSGDDVHIVQFGDKVEVKEEKVEDEEPDEDDSLAQEREDTRKRIHEHITGRLSEAVSKWKETGDVGVNLELPVPLKEKVKGLLSKMKTRSAPLSAMLKNKAEEVMETVHSRLKKAEQLGEKVNADDVVREEWTKVLSKVESVSGKSDREEIEKIYKQLSGED